MTVFLTGGTGLIGSHVAERLRAIEREVVCLQRPDSNTAFLRSLGCRIVQADVRDDPDELAELMKGCRALVHAAALIYADRPWPRVRAVNVTGTRNVLTAAARSGVERALHVSSVAVYGEASAPVDETSPRTTPLPPTDLYARSKRESEDVAFAVHEAEATSVTVLRPAAVYGERDRLFAPWMARLLRFPVTPLLGRGGNTVPIVYAGNVADAAVLALERAEGGRAYNVASDHPVTQRGFLEGLARGMGVRALLLPLPGAAGRWLARTGEALGLTLPGARDLGLRRGADLASRDNPFVSERIREELGWVPPVSASEALARTGRWLRERRAEEEG